MILLGIIAVLVVHLGQSAARHVREPDARIYCLRCGSRFTGAEALGQHMSAAHPPNYPVLRADGTLVED